MKKMKLSSNQSGFTVVEGIAIIVIVAILGFTGWFVWSSQKATSKTLSDTNKSATAQSTKKIVTKEPIAALSKAPTKYDDPTVLTTIYENAPAALKAAIKHTALDKYGNCLQEKNGSLIKTNGNALQTGIFYKPDQVAQTGLGCEPGFSDFYLYVYSGGEWKQVAVTHDNFSCDIVAEYNVAPGFLAKISGDTGIAWCDDKGTLRSL
jgi:hypothetical protein